MSIICVLSLRSPENAARAVEAGAGDFAIQAMQKFPASQQLQKNSCLMIRNLVVRNPENRYVFQSRHNSKEGPKLVEVLSNFTINHVKSFFSISLNRTILLNNGIEKIIRKAKENHESCKDAATDALRDLGLDDYNS